MINFVKIENGVVVQRQGYHEDGFIETNLDVVCGWLYDGETFTAPPVPEHPPVIPQVVTIAQCRLALYDLHEIKTDEEFYALTDILPVEMRPRALLELRTRTTVEYGNPLVIAFCEAKGWNRDELFIYASKL